MIISSKDNAKIKYAKKLLTSASFRKKEGLLLLEGQRLCEDAAGKSAVIKTVFFSPKFKEKFPESLLKLTKSAEESFEVTEEVLLKISDTESCQGVICICKRPEISLPIKREGKYLVLENVSDPSNVGAAARTAEALGTDGILVCGGCDPFSPKVLRASMGALLRFPVEVFADIAKAAERLEKAGVPLYCSVVSNPDNNIGGIDFSAGCAVIIGNEANGATDAARNLSKSCFTIPMAGRAESLNAAAAAAIIIYEMTKG